METDDDEIVLMCMSAVPGSTAHIVRGSVLHECVDCKTPVWVAPSGQKMVREKGALTVCFGCAEKRIQDDETTTFGGITPEQKQELIEALSEHPQRMRPDFGKYKN